MKETDLTPEQRGIWVSVSNCLWERTQKLKTQMSRFEGKKTPASLMKDYQSTMAASKWIFDNVISDWNSLPPEHNESVKKAVELVKLRLTKEVEDLTSLLALLPTL